MSHEEKSDYDSTMATTTRLETDFEKSFSALFDNLICVQILDSSFCFDDSFDNGIVRHFDVRTVFMPWAWKKIEEYAEESQASRLHNKSLPGHCILYFLSCVTYGWFMSHYEWVMSHMSHRLTFWWIHFRTCESLLLYYHSFFGLCG